MYLYSIDKTLSNFKCCTLILQNLQAIFVSIYVWRKFNAFLFIIFNYLGFSTITHSLAAHVCSKSMSIKILSANCQGIGSVEKKIRCSKLLER